MNGRAFKNENMVDDVLYVVRAYDLVLNLNLFLCVKWIKK